MFYDGYNEFGGQEAMGVYAPQNQFDFDPVRLGNLGFQPEEIQLLHDIVMYGESLSTQNLTANGLTYEQAKRLRYMNDICTGKVNIENTDDLSKHLKKMFGNMKKIGIQDLAVSKVSKIPRRCVVDGILDSTYNVYNSRQYPITERMYNVTDVTGGRIIVETARKPVLKYKQAKFIDGVLEIKELKDNGHVIVAFDKKYCRLVNSFAIVGSLRYPEYFHSLIQIICIEGTKVYIYAKTIGTRDSVRYNMNTERVYDYGFYPNEIKPKLTNVAACMYKQLCGVYATEIPGNQDFKMIDTEIASEETDDIAIEE